MSSQESVFTREPLLGFMRDQQFMNAAEFSTALHPQTLWLDGTAPTCSTNCWRPGLRVAQKNAGFTPCCAIPSWPVCNPPRQMAPPPPARRPGLRS